MAHQTPHLHYEFNRPCTNFHGNVRFTPARYCDVWNLWDDSSAARAHRWKPGMLAIQEIIRDSEARDMPGRALGANWSLSDAAVTTGCALNMRPLNVIEVGMRPEHCEERYLRQQQDCGEMRPSDFLAFAQCGATIAELNTELESRGLALTTSGASNGQTIVGAVSTGTHGAAWQFGGVQDFIVGLHLIAEGGECYWIEPASRPVMSIGFCDVLGARLVRDDHLFNAALVSFGSFGVIHAVVLKVEPLYLLEEHLAPRPYADAIAAMSDITNSSTSLVLSNTDGIVPTNPPWHFEILLNPYAFNVSSAGIAEKAGQSAAYVRYMYKHAPTDLRSISPTHRLLGPKPSEQTISVDAFSFLEKLGNLAPLYANTPLAAGLSKQIIEGILQPDTPDHPGTILTPGGMFGATPLTGQGLSCELGFAIQDVPKAIEIVIRQIQAFPLACLPSLRFVGASGGSVAHTCFGPYSCAMEFPAALSDRTTAAYVRIWNALKASGVQHTFHWGQCLNWGETPAIARSRLEAVYGQRLADWLGARRMFLSAKGRKTTFSNQLLGDCGLND